MVRTRATRASPLLFDCDIDRTLFQIRKEIRNQSSGQGLEIIEMGEQMRTLRELTAPNLQNQPLAINIPDLDDGVTFELKPGLIHLLPTFHGLMGKIQTDIWLNSMP